MAVDMPYKDRRVFKNTQPGHNKFWEIWIENAKDQSRYNSRYAPRITVNFGVIGTTGQKRHFFSGSASQKEIDRRVNEKLRKGYIEETTSSGKKSITTIDQSVIDNALLKIKELMK